jgi:hypothetical protein
VLEDRRDSELARFLCLEQVINALRSEFEERPSDLSQGELRCRECRQTSPPETARWRMYLDIEGEAAAFCPECAEREFD